jgi:phosphotriesterase-related protein
MRRRAFLALGAAAAAARAQQQPSARSAQQAGSVAPASGAGVAPTIQTVRGPIAPAALGTTLVHEHVMVDFGGAATAGRSRYDPEAVFRAVLPHLQELVKRGCKSFVECTPAYLARDPRLLVRLAEATGLHILTNTGYYGAANDIAIPQHAYEESEQQLAARWIAEFEHGIDGTAVRPGFLKSGVDAGPLSTIDRKLVGAAALTHLATGLTLAIHTGDGRAAFEILAALDERGVAPSAYVWVHAQNEKDAAQHARAAEQGAWVELDGISPKTLDAHVQAVLELRRRGRLDRVLVSQDAGWYHVGEAGGGSYRPHVFLLDSFVPALREAGLADREIRLLLEENPAAAFAIRPRPKRA